MRIILASIALLLAGCGDPNAATEEALAGARREAAETGRVACAVDGAVEFTRVCTLERAQAVEGTILTLRHPSGGFRRLLVTGDGRGVVAADGAEQAQVSIVGGNGIEVALGGDRYRLPATIKPGG